MFRVKNSAKRCNIYFLFSERKFFMEDYRKEYMREIILNLDSLVLYRTILDDPVIICLKEICKNNDTMINLSKIGSILVENAETFGYGGNLFKNYLLNLFLYNENQFSMYCENNKSIENTSLYNLALNDIKILKSLISIELSSLIKENIPALYELQNYKPVNKSENEFLIYANAVSDEKEFLKTFITFYSTSGCGDISLYRSFKYDDKKEKIIGIKKPDSITFDDIIGYESQTKELIDNTEAFVKGFPANNVLLVGSRGTGKSSSVKALINKYYANGLRLIEITKEQIIKLPELLATLKSRGRRFIIFIDDLSFDEQEIQYKYMKSLLDGGSENKPDNVLFYATSNRRHLIQEKWSDRQRGSESAEIHTQDTLNEKLSLADRFGITISYPKPTPAEYVNIVKIMARRNNIPLSDEILEKEALKWELNQKGISGRTAKQFINHLVWQIKNV